MVKMVWYDGGLMSPTPPELPADVTMTPDGGVMLANMMQAHVAFAG